MYFFIKGLSLSTPINSSNHHNHAHYCHDTLIYFSKGKNHCIKIGGDSLWFTGAILVLYGSAFIKNAPNIPLGNAMLLVNAFSYGAYLVIMKPITKISRDYFNEMDVSHRCFDEPPFGTKELLAVEWQSLPWEAIWRIGFVLLLPPFLHIYSICTLCGSIPPTTIGVLTYVQPIIAIIYATFTGNDQLIDQSLATL